MLKIDFDKIYDSIKTNKPNNILIQLPDGLKPKAEEIVEKILSNTSLKRSQMIIWSGSCYGACDLPNTDEFDLLIHFGHTKWVK